MSKYMEDIQGKVVSNPINETNTKYGYIEKVDGVRNSDYYAIDTQYMYNNNEPVSDFDTAYYDDYRNKVEELRKKTESTYEALESCLVPVEIPGMSFQPFEYDTEESDEGEIIQKKVKSFTYFFQDHLSPIGYKSPLTGGTVKEFVFRTNKVKFIDDRHRRLIYDRTIHLMSLKEDEDNDVSFKQVILRTFFDYYNGKYYSKVRDLNSATYTYEQIARAIVEDIKSSGERYTVIDKAGNEKKIETIDDFDYKLLSGQDINTLIPSSLYNLYNLGWVNAALIFLNGLSISWNKVLISVDSIDTFIIVSNLSKTGASFLDDDKEIYLDYIHIPFKVAYLIGSLDANTIEYDKYITNGKINKQIIFTIDKPTLTTKFTHLMDLYSNSTGYNFDKIICLDDNIRFMEFTLYDGDESNLKDAGINYTKSFRQFCDNDYRCKLKQFNFLGFELNRYEPNDQTGRGTLKNDDFTITWHPFNIMDIRFKRLFNNPRIFKVFYNTKVLYDQDNILRIKNHDKLADEYEKYRKDVTANIETYLNEIYILAKKDIGTYIATNGTMYGYKYNYVTPYECFMLYNTLRELKSDTKISFDEFRKINVSGIKFDSNKYKTQINPKLIVNKDGDCVWVISVDDKQKQCPAVKIVEIATGEQVLADVNYDEAKNNIIITMNKDSKNIQEGLYKVTLYYADIIKSCPAITEENGTCIWREVVKGNVTATAVYDTVTNQVVLTDIYSDTKDGFTSIVITFHNTGNIDSDRYKLVININESDQHSVLNYMNGGFIAVPVNEDSMFMEKLDEKDFYQEDGTVNPKYKDYLSNILNSTNATIPDILIPIDNEIRDDQTQPNDAFISYEGDTKGKILPYTPIMKEFGLEQEYTDLTYDSLKLRFELVYLNNVEEGATPIDEFIYYLDNDYLINLNKYPVVLNYRYRKTANILNAIAKNIFKYDPNMVLDSIIKMNYSADFIIPKEIDKTREDIIITSNEEPPTSGYDYIYDPRFYYNYGYYDKDNKPHRLQSEWGLRRNLPEMFYWSLDEKEYTLDSMHLLDEVFNFTYDFNQTYEENLKNGLNYIVGYDADKLEQSIKRSIVSFSKTGAELKKLQSQHPYKKYCTLDGYKIMTFLKNNSQKVLFDNVKLQVVLNKSYGNLATVSELYYIRNGRRIQITQDTYLEMMFKDQTNPTITKNAASNSITDVDKNFRQLYTDMKYNRDTDLLMFYNNDEIVITTQVDEVIDNSKLEMSRWNIGKQYNYVMIFKNRELYDRYSSIQYTDISFSIDFNPEYILNSDVFEFVFFLNANNLIMKKVCETDDDLSINIPTLYASNSPNRIRTDKYGNPMDKGLYESITENKDFSPAIACNTSLFDAENVQLLVNIMPSNKDDKWTVAKTDNTTYELSFNVLSYKQSVTMDTNKKFYARLTTDTKLNGLYRVTKQGGGEYFLTFDGKVPNNDGTTGGGVHIKPGDGGGTSGISGIGLMALATQNVREINFSGTMEQWNKISKTLPWIRDATNLNNSGGIKCKDGNIKVKAEETQNGSV